MADGYFTPTTHAVMIPETWRKEIIIAVYNLMVMRNIVMELGVPPGTDTLHFPNIAKLVAEQMTPGTELVGNVNTETKTDLSIDQLWAVPMTIHDQTLIQIQQNINVLDLYTQRAAEALAYKMDQLLLGLYSGLSQTIAAGGDITIALINQAARLLDVAGAPQTNRFGVISPYQKEALLAVGNIIQAHQYGSSVPLIQGEIGMLGGFRLFVTENVITSTTRRNLFFHRDAFMLAIQQDIDIKSLYMPLKGGLDVVLKQLYGYGERRDTWACEITTTD